MCGAAAGANEGKGQTGSPSALAATDLYFSGPTLTRRVSLRSTSSAQRAKQIAGACKNLLRRSLLQETAVHNLLHGKDRAPQKRFFLHDANIRMALDEPRHRVIEAADVTQPVAGFELVVPL
jgi:hypothetical protein